MNDQGNIIHVEFGPGGGKRPAPARIASSEHELSPSLARGKEPISDLYSARDVSKLFGIGPSRLKYWERSGFIIRTGREGRRRYYTFLDLIGIRVAKGLLDQGVPLRRVRRSTEALRESLPKVARPLSSLRVFADGRSLIVKDDNGTFEPATGQTVIDFEVGSLRDDVVRVLRRGSPVKAHRAAYDYYLEGCRLDQDEATLSQAEAAYRRAIEIDPSLANAFTNLGNLLYSRGDTDTAELMYHKALKVDAEQPEALYNLGFILYNKGDYDGALENFLHAVQSAPSFADAHFNLAMVLEELGKRQEARPHWETYIKLDPNTSWSEIARKHLE